MKLNPVHLGVSAGVIWGISVFLMALIATGTTYGVGFVSALGALYLGYTEGILGAILGLVYGFLDGFIGFYLLAFIYNKLEK